jgi:hypothetical protein
MDGDKEAGLPLLFSAYYRKFALLYSLSATVFEKSPERGGFAIFALYV